MDLSCSAATSRFGRRKPVPRRKPTTRIERFGKPIGRDVLLLVGSESTRQVFVLAESILRQLGPRWVQLLSSRSSMKSTRSFRKSYRGLSSRRGRESFSDSPTILNLRDDHADSVRVLLLIATLQFAKVPKALDFVDIVRLIEVAVRYDARSLLALYVEGWLAPYRSRLLSPGYEEWLFVAQELGYEAEYSELAKYLAVNCCVDASGEKLMMLGSSCPLGGRVAADTIAQIRESREAIILKTLNATYDLWTSICKGNNCRVTQAGDSSGQGHCAGTNLVVFTDFLRELDLYPMLRKPTHIRCSPKELAAKLSDVMAVLRIAESISTRRRASAPMGPPEHIRCHVGFQLKAVVSRVLEEVSWPMDGLAPSRSEQGRGEYLNSAHESLVADIDGSPRSRTNL